LKKKRKRKLLTEPHPRGQRYERVGSGEEEKGGCLLNGGGGGVNVREQRGFRMPKNRKGKKTPRGNREGSQKKNSKVTVQSHEMIKGGQSTVEREGKACGKKG